MYAHIDLFSGIGGMALGLSRAGIKTVQFVEIDPFCQKVLNKNFPGVPIWNDIKTFKYSGTTRPFLLSAGCPCQPASCAGKRKGKEDDRWLWDEAFRVLAESRPTWAIFENVAGLLSLESGVVFDNLLTQMENQGYEVWPVIIPACAVGAPHRRDRVWIVANRPDTRIEGLRRERENTVFQDADAQDSQGVGRRSRRTESTGFIGCSGTSGTDCHAADTNRFNGDDAGFDSSKVSQLKKAEIFGMQSTPEQRGFHTEFSGKNRAWDEPWIEAAGRLCGIHARLPEELYKLETSDRVGRLKALGNAVVPQIVEILGRAIMEIEKC